MKNKPDKMLKLSDLPEDEAYEQLIAEIEEAEYFAVFKVIIDRKFYYDSPETDEIVLKEQIIEDLRQRNEKGRKLYQLALAAEQRLEKGHPYDREEFFEKVGEKVKTEVHYWLRKIGLYKLP